MLSGEHAGNTDAPGGTSGANQPTFGRPQRWLAVATVSGLLVASAAAFAITERLKLTPSPIAGTRVSKTFSPVCRCASDSASVSFRLRRGGPVEVDVIERGGTVVRRLARRRFRPGTLSFRWLGRGLTGNVSSDGDYLIRVHLPSEHRTIVFPNVIRLDTVAPKVKLFRVSRHTIAVGERTRVAYRFDGPAHPIVIVDGREAIYGRFAHASGTVDWFGRVGGLAVRAGIHRLAIEGRDDAGNTSAESGGIVVRVRARPATRRHSSKSKH